MAETIFAKILRGEIPCHRVYEDAHVLAFLDVFPLSRGHTLVIPKEPAATLDQLSDDAAAAIGRALPRICRAVLKASGATAFDVLQANVRSMIEQLRRLFGGSAGPRSDLSGRARRGT